MGDVDEQIDLPLRHLTLGATVGLLADTGL
jgi:hypothetical protein